VIVAPTQEAIETGQIPPNPTDQLVLIGMGANLPSAFGTPQQTLERALPRLTAAGASPLCCSRWWRSEPVPISDQPWFVNGVISVATDLSPTVLLDRLHEIEAEFGRVRSTPNAPRLLDLDLLAFGRLCHAPGPPLLPHPRLSVRAFVLRPLQDIAPAWRHPVNGRSLADLIAELPADQIVLPI